MTTYAELVESVVAITNRPSLIAEMKVAIRKAIFKFHMADTFKRDLYQVDLNMNLYPSSNFRWLIDLSNGDVFPRYRKFYSLRIPPSEWPPGGPVQYPLDTLPGYPWGPPKSPQISYVAADNIFDEYNTERTNYCYQAGMSLNLRLTFTPNTLSFFYYQYPLFQVSDSGITIRSWIADQFQDGIAEEAAGTIFKMIGKDDESARYQALFAENILMVRGSDIGEDGQ